MSVITLIDKNWEFSQLHNQEPLEWLPASKVPTSVHVELIKAGKVPDPVSLSQHSLDTYLHQFVQFTGQNEWEVQCDPDISNVTICRMLNAVQG